MILQTLFKFTTKSTMKQSVPWKRIRTAQESSSIETSLKEIEMNKKQYSANDGLRAESMLMEESSESVELLLR